MSDANKFKKLFDEKDFQMANKNGLEFMKQLKEEIPEIKVYENESQARTDVFEGTPGFDDDADIMAEIGGLKIFFEITGDGRYTEDESRILFFNRFSVEKLIKEDDGKSKYSFAVYYLAKEKPTKFFILRAKNIKDKYKPSETKKTVRGDTGVKYKIPIGKWYSIKTFIRELRKNITVSDKPTE